MKELFDFRERFPFTEIKSREAAEKSISRCFMVMCTIILIDAWIKGFTLNALYDNGLYTLPLLLIDLGHKRSKELSVFLICASFASFAVTAHKFNSTGTGLEHVIPPFILMLFSIRLYRASKKKNEPEKIKDKKDKDDHQILA